MTTLRKRYRIVNLTDGTVLTDACMTLGEALACLSTLREQFGEETVCLSAHAAAELMLIPDDGDDIDSAPVRSGIG